MRTHESRDIGRVTHDKPSLVGHVHLDQDVAWEHVFLDVFHLAVDLSPDGLSRDLDAQDVFFHVVELGAVQQVLFDLVFVAGVSLDDKPALVQVYGKFLFILVLIFISHGFTSFW